MSLARTAIVVLFSRVFALTVAAFGLLYFTRELGPSLFGSFVLFRTLVVLLGMFVDLGINDAVEKRLSEGQTAGVLSSALLMKGVALLVLSACIALLGPTIDGFIGLDIGLALVPVIAVDQLGRILAATLRGEHRVDLAEVGQTIQGVGFIIGGIGLVYLGWGVEGLVTSLFTSWTAVAAWFGYKTDTSLAKPTQAAFDSVGQFAKYNFFSSIIGHTAYNWIDTFVIGLFLGPTFVAGYEIAWRITKLTTLLSKVIGKTIFPQISEWDATDERERIQEILPDALLGSIVFVVPAVFGIVLLGEEIIGLMFGQEYTFAVGAAAILMASKVFDAVSDIESRVLLGMGRPADIARAVTVFVIVNLGGNLVLVSLYGIVGAAVATSLAIATLVVLLTYYLRQELTVTVERSSLGVVLAASLAMASVIGGLKVVVGVNSVPVLLGMIATAVVAYLAVLAASANFRRQLTAIWQSV